MSHRQSLFTKEQLWTIRVRLLPVCRVRLGSILEQAARPLIESKYSPFTDNYKEKGVELTKIVSINS